LLPWEEEVASLDPFCCMQVCSQKQQTQVMLDQVSTNVKKTEGPNCKKIYIKLQTRELDKKLALVILQQKKNIQ
jgi:hypothetical protein